MPHFPFLQVPAEEIPLVGHPTIATIFALIDSGRLRLTGAQTTVSLELRVGPIRIVIEASGGLVKHISMSQKKPQFLKTYPAEDVLPILGLTRADVLPNAPIQTVSTGAAPDQPEHSRLSRSQIREMGHNAIGYKLRFCPDCQGLLAGDYPQIEK